MSAAATQAPFADAGVTKPDPKRRLPVLPVGQMLKAQQTLTAVERFARRHDAGEILDHSHHYRDLLPLERPKSGQQYAFEVDLDLCTGCKACVAACHTLNGLDSDELWRTVGLLHGGTPHAPALQTVTTSCHHCLDPACLSGCPTRAYEKDPVTGIVKHLDDQCFGCQYCSLMCPYDAPKYSKSRGIVRKCDMCSDRLAHGEAPACVQGCPNQAIAIRVIEQAAVVESSDARGFLPGAPDPEHTLPTTVYKSKKPIPSNMLPADFYTTSPEHPHPPLVVMLTLTQLSAGALVLGLLIERLAGSSAGSSLGQAVFAAAFAVVALAASIFHLGRPHLFFRAVLGLRTSWLSREAIGFGVFAKLAILYALFVAAPILPDFPLKSELVRLTPIVHAAAALMGLVGVYFSVMVYVATRRPQWSGTQTGVKFFGTTLLLGAAGVLFLRASSAPFEGELDRATVGLLGLVIAATVIKLAFEARLLRHRRDKQRSIWKRMAFVMLGDLRMATALRFALAAAGGVGLPLLVLGGWFEARALPAATAALLGLVLSAELTERYLFFRAAPASRMPGGIR